MFSEDKEYLSRVLTAANYSEVCKELLSVNLRTDLAGLPPSKQDNLILPTATLAGKPTVEIQAKKAIFNILFRFQGLVWSWMVVRLRIKCPSKEAL